MISIWMERKVTQFFFILFIYIVGPNRFDAMFTDLAAQIDNLPDDGEDDGVFWIVLTCFERPYV